MKARKIRERVYWVGAVDWERRIFDSLIPLPDGTSYNSYLVQGNDSIALIDTVDPSTSEVLLGRLSTLNVDRIDYIIANHAEQDHSGTIPYILARFPEAKVICTPRAKSMLLDLLHIAAERIVTVQDGEKLELGGKTLEFIHTPWVHWPETMVTYLHEDKILFSCDFFGSHLATADLYAGDDWRVFDGAKRYYAEIMMPFRGAIRRNLQRIGEYEIAMIAPSHGPIHDQPKRIIDAHTYWISDALTNTVVLPYVSMHGSTKTMVDFLTESLIDKGVRVEKFDLTVTDLGHLAMALVDAATLVVGSPTVLAGAHPQVISAAFLANALRPKIRFASVVGSYGWGGKTVEQITTTLSNLKVEILEPVLSQGAPRDEDFQALERLATEIVARHKENNIM